MTFPQYAETHDPAVIAAIEQNRLGVLEFHDRACKFAQAQGVEAGTYYPSSFAGLHCIRAIGGDAKPTTGRWKAGYGGYGWLPYKNNPLTAEFEGLKFSEADVPGLPVLVDGPYQRSGGHVVATPRPFVHAGAAYVGFSFMPIDTGSPSPKPEDGGWVEIKASEYFTAAEAEDARRKAEQSTIPEGEPTA